MNARVLFRKEKEDVFFGDSTCVFAQVLKAATTLSEYYRVSSTQVFPGFPFPWIPPFPWASIGPMTLAKRNDSVNVNFMQYFDYGMDVVQ